MSRESMRAALTTALTTVGVVVPERSSAEFLVNAACTRMISQDVVMKGAQQRSHERCEKMRAALRRLGADPGTHALESDMLDELIRLAEGRVIG